MVRNQRYHALDAVRAAALVLGIVFHIALSFCLPKDGWPVQDWSRSSILAPLAFIAHNFRMQTFFFIGGFFGRLMLHRKGARWFVRDRAKRILLPLVVGWFVIGFLTTWPWISALQRAGAVPAPGQPGGASALKMTLQLYSSGASFRAPGFSLMQLWFLYYLLLFYAAGLTCRYICSYVDRQGRLQKQLDASLRVLHGAPLGLILLSVPLIAATWLCTTTFGVDTPRTLLPEWPGILAFGSFFGFGWLLQRQPSLLTCWRDRWAVHAILGVVLSLCAFLIFQKTPITTPPSRIGALAPWYVLTYGSAMILLVAGFIGFFEKFVAMHSRLIRYLADSSYWLYLAHLPLIVALQVLVASWHLHWTTKFGGILVVTLTVLMASYHYLVRDTVIGSVLNGPRKKSIDTSPDPVKSDRVLQSSSL